MKRKIANGIVIFMLLAVCGIFTGAREGKAVTWSKKTYTVTKGKFKFYAHLSKNKKKSWVYLVKPKKKKASPTSLKFPKKIKKAAVTRIGADMSIMGDGDNEFYKNIFDVWVEYAHGCDGYCRANSKIKTMSLPPALTQIDYTSFSGMSALTKVRIPDKVKVLHAETFYGCRKLKEVKLPKNLSSFSNYLCFDDCPKLDKVTLSRKNKKYTVSNDILMSKDNKTLIWAIPKKTTITVPDTIETIESGAFFNSQVKNIKLGKYVTNLKSSSIMGTKIETISIDEGNPAYAVDGQCIYNKKDASLVVGIAKNAQLVISDKVKKLTGTASLCGSLSEDRQLYLLDIPASVIWLGKNWDEVLPVSGLSKVYFRGATPPQVEKKGGYYAASLPVFCDIYVPKGSLSVYKNWYKKLDLYEDTEKEEWHTF